VNPDQSYTITLPGGVPMELRNIKPGSFTMGSNATTESPAHQVNISYSFMLGKSTVTYGQWKAIFGVRHWSFPYMDNDRFRQDSDPVKWMSWDTGVDFLHAAIAVDGIECAPA